MYSVILGSVVLGYRHEPKGLPIRLGTSGDEVGGAPKMDGIGATYPRRHVP